jgi:hypothetical protein
MPIKLTARAIYRFAEYAAAADGHDTVYIDTDSNTYYATYVPTNVLHRE